MNDAHIRLILAPKGDPKVDAFVTQRIFEYNTAATGYDDAEAFCAHHAGEDGGIVAGITGYTWGGCCYVSYLWVAEPFRGRGLGADLLRAAEDHARTRRCRQILLCSHTFQAPAFYVKQGFRKVAEISDYPLGHGDIFLAKRLDISNPMEGPP